MSKRTRDGEEVQCAAHCLTDQEVYELSIEHTRGTEDFHQVMYAEKALGQRWSVDPQGQFGAIDRSKGKRAHTTTDGGTG